MHRPPHSYAACCGVRLAADVFGPPVRASVRPGCLTTHKVRKSQMLLSHREMLQAPGFLSVSARLAGIRSRQVFASHLSSGRYA